MRTITTQPPPDSGPQHPIPTSPTGERESIALIWSREIAVGVAHALDTPLDQASYRLTLREDMPIPQVLRTTFAVAGHRVLITVWWDNPWREAAYALSVDDQPVALDQHSDDRAAVVIAHAAWRHIADLDHSGGRVPTPAPRRRCRPRPRR